MSVLIIEGGRPLRGSVDISGAKNSALAIVVAAALATEGECVLDNIPQGSDVNTICQILQDLGWRCGMMTSGACMSGGRR